MIDDVFDLYEVTVAGTYDASATAITLLPSDPNLGRIGTVPFYLLWWNKTHYPNPANDPKAEYVRATANPTSNTLTVVRGQLGTAESSKDTAGATYAMARVLTSADIDAAASSRAQIDGWYQDNVAASQTSVELSRLSGPGAYPKAFVPVRAGSITKIGVISNEARTAGTLTVEVAKNGTPTGLQAQINDVDMTYADTEEDPGLDSFVAGDRLTVEITTSSDWAPTTADIQVSLEVED